MNDRCHHSIIRPLQRGDVLFSRNLTPDEWNTYLMQGCSSVAMTGGICSGYLLAQPLSYVAGSPLTLWIDEIAVVPTFRRRGIATALCRHRVAMARQQGTRAILTNIDANNRGATRLFQQAGFVEHAMGRMVLLLDTA